MVHWGILVRPNQGIVHDIGANPIFAARIYYIRFDLIGGNIVSSRVVTLHAAAFIGLDGGGHRFELVCTATLKAVRGDKSRPSSPPRG